MLSGSVLGFVKREASKIFKTSLSLVVTEFEIDTSKLKVLEVKTADGARAHVIV